MIFFLFVFGQLISFIFSSQQEKTDPERNPSNWKTEGASSTSKHSESESNYPEANLKSGGHKQGTVTAEQKCSTSSSDRETER